MDFVIIFQSIFSFILFFIAHIVVFSYKKSKGILTNLLSTYISIVIIHFVITYIIAFYLPILVDIDPLIKFAVYPLISFVLLSLMTFSFILAIFGITVTSLRIQMLTKILHAGINGLTKNDILKQYSQEVILQTRFKRLTESGELISKNNKYYPRKNLSYFTIHTYALVFINALYNLKGYLKYR
jgi:hypothetical protein